MNFIKRSVLCLLAAIILLLTSTTVLSAQTTLPDSISKIVEQERQIAWNLFRLIGGNANKFSAYKGDLVEKLSSGSTAYKVNDLVETGVTNEFILVQPNGTTFYWGYITGDEAKLNRFYVAFTYGVGIFGKKNDIPLEAKHDLALSTDTIEVYNMMVGDVKVGTFTEDKSKKSINIFIGVLN